MNRSYFHADRIVRLADELSERELAILSTLERVRLATGGQIETLLFDTNTSRHRRRVLQSLTELRLIARLDRRIGGRRAGSAGHLFALDIGGQHVLHRVTNRAVRRPTTPGSRYTQHVLLVTSIYVGLVQAERRGLIELLDFEAEPASWRRYPGPGGGLAVVKPDAYVRIGNGGFLESWFLEIDRATESTSTLAHKADITGPTTPVASNRAATGSSRGSCGAFLMSAAIRWWSTSAAANRPTPGRYTRSP